MVSFHPLETRLQQTKYHDMLTSFINIVTVNIQNAIQYQALKSEKVYNETILEYLTSPSF